MDGKTTCGNGLERPISQPMKKLLAFYMAYEEDNGRPPTLREAAAFMGMSYQCVSEKCRKLKKRGLMDGGGTNKPSGERCYRATIGRAGNGPRDDG